MFRYTLLGTPPPTTGISLRSLPRLPLRFKCPFYPYHSNWMGRMGTRQVKGWRVVAFYCYICYFFSAILFLLDLGEVGRA